MITAWVLYTRDYTDDIFEFRQLTGTSFDDTDPRSWGLGDGCHIILVLQSAQFLGAWVEGDRKEP